MKISLEEVARIRHTQGARRMSGNVPSSLSRTGAATQGAASVEISGAAQEIQRVKKAVQAAPDIRADLVTSLKNRIDSGSYNVSGADIADLMVRRALADNAR